MSIVVNENLATCANCWTTAEIPEARIKTTRRPEGWGTVLITTNLGILSNNLICDTCLGWVKQGLETARGGSVPNAGLQQKIADAKAAGATEVTVEQVGTGKTATVDISEFEGQSYQELVDVSVAETDAAYSEHEAEIDAIKQAEPYFSWVSDYVLKAGDHEINFEELSQVDLANLNDIYLDNDTEKWVKDDIISTGEKFSDCEAGEFPKIMQNAWNAEFGVGALEAQERQSDMDAAVSAASQLTPEALQESAVEAQELNKDEAHDSAPIPADRDTSLDAAPVQVDAPAASVKDVPEGEFKQTPKRPTNNNRRRTSSGK